MPKEPPGKLVRDEIQEFEVPTDILTQVSINLSDFLESDFGHFIIIAKPHRGIFEEENYWETIQTWVQVTQIGLDVFTDHSEMVVWTSNLNDGSPLSGAVIRLILLRSMLHPARRHCKIQFAHEQCSISCCPCWQ